MINEVTKLNNHVLKDPFVDYHRNFLCVYFLKLKFYCKRKLFIHIINIGLNQNKDILFKLR